MLTRSLPAACLLVSLTLVPAIARKKKVTPAEAKPAPVVQMTNDEKTLHALNRLAFGPRPGDLQSLDATGLKKWIEEQLHPESIAENPELDAKLAPMDTLRLSTPELVAKYPPNFLVKQMVDGKAPWPEDPQTRMLIQKVVQRYRDKLGLATDAKDQLTFEQALAEVPQDQQELLTNGTPDQKVAILQSLPVEKQFDIVIAMPKEQRRKMFEAAPVSMRRRMETFAGTQQLVNQDLADAKLFRAVYSNRQLEEVLTDFWYNHFNVFLDKGADRYMVTAYERDAIRPFVLGKFKDLLLATAQSPAMLFYLDNFQSVRSDMDTRNPRANVNAKRAAAKRGLNENYGRELMELHTLGVDGGYTQKDVTEVARCFTGWTIREPRRGGGFEFNEKQHDPGEKHVLGVTIPANGGIEDGYKVIEILSRQPATAHFISKSLAIRFVSDNPPEALVQRMADTFQKTDGDLREVMRTMIYAQEFWSQDVYHAKIKSPFEMVVSALRATNADIDFTNAISGQLNQMGEPLYKKQEPTGYSNKGSDWMNSAALLGRMNFALNLTANHMGGVKVGLPATTDPGEMAHDLMGMDLTPASLEVVQKGLAAEAAAKPANTPVKPAAASAVVAGLTLGSPDFQRR